MEDLKKLEIDMTITGVNPELAEQTIKALTGVDGIEDYLRETMASDVKRHFNATSPMEQLLVKGAYFRTKYLLNQIQKVGQKKTEKSLKLGRYARGKIAKSSI